MCRLMKISIRLGLTALLLYAVTGCKTSSTTVTPPTAPGFTSQADQTMYSTLAAAESFYVVLQQDAQSGKWVPSQAEKQALNTFAVTLNAAIAEYQAFKSGTATQAQAQAAVDKVSAAQTQLQAVIPPPPQNTRS